MECVSPSRGPSDNWRHLELVQVSQSCCCGPVGQDQESAKCAKAHGSPSSSRESAGPKRQQPRLRTPAWNEGTRQHEVLSKEKVVSERHFYLHWPWIVVFFQSKKTGCHSVNCTSRELAVESEAKNAIRPVLTSPSLRL